MASELEKESNQTRLTRKGLITGVLLGYPLSYYFQPAGLRAKMSMGEYIRHFSDIVGSDELKSAVLIGFVVAIVVGAAVGSFIGKSRDENGGDQVQPR